MVKDEKKGFFYSGFVRNSAVLIGGNVVGQAVALAVYPILSRIYSKEDFGAFALFMSLTGVIGIISTGRYEEAFLLTSSRKEAASLLGFCFLILSSVCLAVFAVLGLWGEGIFGLMGLDSLASSWAWIAIYVLLTGFFSLMGAVANRERLYGLIASSNLLLNVSSSVFKTVFRYVGGVFGGLIAGQVVGQMLAALPFWRMRDYVRRALGSALCDMKEAARRYGAFPRYTLPRNFINSFSGNLPFFLLTGVFGEARLGLFFLAFTVSFRPISLISNSFYQVLYQDCARLKAGGSRISGRVNGFLRYGAACFIPVFIIIYIFSNILFKYIFGSEWEEAGAYLRYILPWIFMVMMVTPIGFMPLLMDKQSSYVLLEAAYLVFRFAALYAGIYLKDFDLSIILFGLIGFIFMLISLVWYLLLIKKYEKHIE
jgi:O-antigen/teichoic acid export membrane protein